MYIYNYSKFVYLLFLSFVNAFPTLKMFTNMTINFSVRPQVASFLGLHVKYYNMLFKFFKQF